MKDNSRDYFNSTFMNKLKIVILAVFSFFSLLTTEVEAQDYKTALGLRGGPGYGVTIKHFVSPAGALEGIVSPRWNGVVLTALYEKHAVAFDAKRLKYYGGGGAHVGLWNYRENRNSNNPWVNDYDNHTVVGVDLVLGIEYTFGFIPFTIGVDWKPMLNLINDGSIWFNDVAFSLRFIPGNI